MRPITEAYKDFPILQKEHNGHRLVYLDSGATTQIPQMVIDRLTDHMLHHNHKVRDLYFLFFCS